MRKRRKYGYLLLTMLVISGLAGTPHNNSLNKKERKFAAEHMKDTKDDFLKTIKDMTEAQLNYRPTADKWTAKECAYHIAVSEKNLWSLLESSLKSAANPEKRSEIKITDEQLMGKFTIAVEGLAQSATDIKQAGIRAGQRTLLKKLDKFAPAIDKTATAISGFALEANTGNKNISELITQLQKLITGQAAQANAIITLARSKGNQSGGSVNATMGFSGVVK